ncbi:MAG: PLP-dependent transferase, partial [Burkholderiales bacterium]|nr:PLP-dependent transferase [Burkholderiales bacterium]
GGPVSLAVPYQARFMRELPTAYDGVLVRLCIGLEAVEDLIADLDAGLQRLG